MNLSSERFSDVEELETFLQQRPILVFGRDARELLILFCTAALAYSLWQVLAPLQQVPLLLISELLLIGILTIFGGIVALIKIASTYYLEDWLCICLAYALLPKLFLYQPNPSPSPYKKRQKELV